MLPIKLGTLCLVVYAPRHPEYLGHVCTVVGRLGDDNYVTDLHAPPPAIQVNARRECLRPLDDTLPPEPLAHLRAVRIPALPGESLAQYRARLLGPPIGFWGGLPNQAAK